jgi:Flp pilus assembly protein TadB
MNQRTTHTRYVEMGLGRRGGFWAGLVAVLSGIVVIVLAVLFSALFLGLFVAIAAGLMVRAWLFGRGKPAQPKVIDAEYTVIDPGDSQGRRSKP